MEKIESCVLREPCTSVYAAAAYVREAIAKAPRVALEALRELDRQSPLRNLRDRSIARLNSVDGCLEQTLPALLIQKKLDVLGAYLEKKFSVFTPFHNWLLDNGQGEWYKQLALFLVKLPIKSACNIVQLLYGIVRAACYTAVHPLKSVNALAKLLVRLAYELTKPEIWAKIGAGVIGGTLGYGVFGNPISPISIGIGAAMIAGGVSLGAVFEAIKAEEGNRQGAVREYLLRQARELPESFLTSFFTGLIIGGVQRAVAAILPHHISPEEARKLADELVQSNKLPPYSSVSVTPDGKVVTITWTGEGIHANELKQFFIRIGDKNTCLTPAYDEQMEKVSLTIYNTEKYARLYYYWQDKPLMYWTSTDDPPGVFHTGMGTFTWKEWFGRHMGFDAIGSVDGLSLGWKIPPFPVTSIPGAEKLVLGASAAATTQQLSLAR